MSTFAESRERVAKDWTTSSTLASHIHPAQPSTLIFPDPNTLSEVEKAKRHAAHAAVDANFPKTAKAVGIGSGSTIVYAVERILQLEGVGEVIFVPTGFQSKELIEKGGLRLGEISGYSELDVAFDGADEVDANLNCIKGGGACLFQEKLVASCAKKFIIVADYRKQSMSLGHSWIQGVPIEVVPLSQTRVLTELSSIGAQNPQLRMGGKAKAGPVITDNGNFIIDAPFGEISDPVGLATKIKQMIGVVEVGLFVNMAHSAWFGNEDGSVTIRERGAAERKYVAGIARGQATNQRL